MMEGYCAPHPLLRFLVWKTMRSALVYEATFQSLLLRIWEETNTWLSFAFISFSRWAARRYHCTQNEQFVIQPVCNVPHRSPDVSQKSSFQCQFGTFRLFYLAGSKENNVPDSQTSGWVMQLSLLRLAATQPRPSSVTPVARSRGGREKRTEKKWGRKRGLEWSEQLPSLSAGFSALTNGLHKRRAMERGWRRVCSSCAHPLSLRLCVSVTRGLLFRRPRMKDSPLHEHFYPHLVAISLWVGARCALDERFALWETAMVYPVAAFLSRIL